MTVPRSGRSQSGPGCGRAGDATPGSSRRSRSLAQRQAVGFGPTGSMRTLYFWSNPRTPPTSSRSWAGELLALGVEGYLVSVWVGEREGPPERPVKGLGHDRVTVRGERVVDLLGVRCVQPHRDAFSGLLDGVQIDSGQGIADGECDRLGVKDNCVRRPCGVADQTEVLLVESGGAFDVTDLKGDEVG